MNPKKILYITIFTITGILFSFILHGIIEVPVLYLCYDSVDKLNSNICYFSHSQWLIFHRYFTFVLFGFGVILGVLGGFWGWRKVYGKGAKDPNFLKKK